MNEMGKSMAKHMKGYVFKSGYWFCFKSALHVSFSQNSDKESTGCRWRAGGHVQAVHSSRTNGRLH